MFKLADLAPNKNLNCYTISMNKYQARSAWGAPWMCLTPTLGFAGSSWCHLVGVELHGLQNTDTHTQPKSASPTPVKKCQRHMAAEICLAHGLAALLQGCVSLLWQFVPVGSRPDWSHFLCQRDMGPHCRNCALVDETNEFKQLLEWKIVSFAILAILFPSVTCHMTVTFFKCVW